MPNANFDVQGEARAGLDGLMQLCAAPFCMVFGGFAGEGKLRRHFGAAIAYMVAEQWCSTKKQGEVMDTKQSGMDANAIVAAIDIRNALKLTMKRLYYTPKTLSTGLGIPCKVVKCWVDGRGVLSREQYLALCKHLGVDRLEGARI